MNWQRPIEEFQQALATQVSFLRSSNAAFDSGNHWEAVRLANAVFIIVHDGGQKSLLTRLRVRGKLRFPSSGREIIPGNTHADMPLIGMWITETGASYSPMLDSGHSSGRLLQFHQWWNKDVIYRDPQNRTMTRQSLVFALRNKEGGGHVDGEIDDPTYVGVSRENTANWFCMRSDQQGPSNLSPGAHFASMRQIAWELEQALIAGGLVAPP